MFYACWQQGDIRQSAHRQSNNKCFMSVPSKVLLDDQLTVNQIINVLCLLTARWYQTISSPSEAVDGLPSDLRDAVDAGRVSVVGGQRLQGGTVRGRQLVQRVAPRHLHLVLARRPLQSQATAKAGLQQKSGSRWAGVRGGGVIKSLFLRPVNQDGYISATAA